MDRDEKHVISTLNDQAAKLHEQNNGLMLEKKKKEITELNRIISTMKKSQPAGKEKPGSSSSSSSSSSSGSSMNNTTVNAVPAETTMRPSSAIQKLPDDAQLNDSSLLEVARKYKAR